MRLLYMIAAGVTVVAIAPAAARAAWTTPLPVTAPAASVAGVEAAFWPDGAALLTWRDLPLDTPTDPVPRGSDLGYVAIRNADGARITRLTTHEHVVARPYGAGRLVVLRARSGSLGSFDRVGCRSATATARSAASR